MVDLWVFREVVVNLSREWESELSQNQVLGPDEAPT